MPHGLDVSRLEEVFDALALNSEKLSDWEKDRLPEWFDYWTNGGTLSDKQLEILERMYLKV